MTDPLGNFGNFLFKQGLVELADLHAAKIYQEKYGFLRLGEILIRMGTLSFDELLEALIAFRKQARIGDLLVMEGTITRRQLKEALELQEKGTLGGMMLGQILVEIEACGPEDVMHTLSLKKDEVFEPFMPLG